jgi:hypothetical protein
VIVLHADLEGPAGNAAADHCAASGINVDAAEREDGLLEVPRLGDGGLQAQVLHPGGIQHHGVGRSGSAGGAQRKGQEEGKTKRE